MRTKSVNGADRFKELKFKIKFKFESTFDRLPFRLSVVYV
jgi:hypothetical protein